MADPADFMGLVLQHALAGDESALAALSDGDRDRLRQHQPSAAPAQFRDELEIRLLGSEAEAVVLDDPFAL